MSSHRVRPELAIVLAMAICLLFLSVSLLGIMTRQDPMMTKAESFIRLQHQLLSSPQVTLRP